MATVTDTLLTLLRLQGAESYAAAMGLAGKATRGLAEAQSFLTKNGAGLRTALSALGESAAFTTTAVGALAFAIGDSLKTFAQDQEAIFRATVVLKNLGNSYPIGRAQAFASAIQKNVAVDDEAIVSLIGLEKQFGIADNQVEKTAKTILDFSKATGIDLPEAGEIFLRAVNGQARGLRRLGIQFQDTGSKVRNLLVLQEKFNNLFGGAAAAERNTLLGSTVALVQSLANALSAVGDKLSAIIIPIENLIGRIADFLAANPGVSLALLGAGIGAKLGGAPGAAIGFAAGAALGFIPNQPNAAEQIGTGKEKLATEDTLQKIANNTAALSPFIQQVIGGPGTVAKGAFTFRDARMAFGI